MNSISVDVGSQKKNAGTRTALKPVGGIVGGAAGIVLSSLIPIDTAVLAKLR